MRFILETSFDIVLNVADSADSEVTVLYLTLLS